MDKILSLGGSFRAFISFWKLQHPFTFGWRTAIQNNKLRDAKSLSGTEAKSLGAELSDNSLCVSLSHDMILAIGDIKMFISAALKKVVLTN